MNVTGEMLRHVMRHWTSGVVVVTSRFEDQRFGMTVNSFTSMSLEPPLVVVTLANSTHTRSLVEQSGVFGVTILHEGQAEISDRFAGRTPAANDRFAGLETFELVSGSPLLSSGLASLDCQVIHRYSSESSTLYVGLVNAVKHTREGSPLVYHNRLYHQLGG
jgi:flavin reductase (DIM6/NTAB) family NADH-FMN oxidoreductase RutF